MKMLDGTDVEESMLAFGWDDIPLPDVGHTIVIPFGTSVFKVRNIIHNYREKRIVIYIKEQKGE